MEGQVTTNFQMSDKLLKVLRPIHFLAPFRTRFMSRMALVPVGLCLASEEIRTASAVTNGPFAGFLCPLDSSNEAGESLLALKPGDLGHLPIISPSLPRQSSSKDIFTG